ncbi:TIGR02186 family protein [uncultured Sneathiella sp.]|uniref:TIGR02186 family protein n=1 Tax=uncultured Sneathiella sp. TaxID=879315 RepID=UPI0030DBD758|tara:strand:+ start:278 stop:1057 length:780 start_codon:yes stop_codon:yes gene_type:complete
MTLAFRALALSLTVICTTCLITNEPARAQSSLVTDISSHLISVTSDFTGTELLLFGAIQYEDDDFGQGQGDVLVVVRGPEKDVIVRRKERVAGIWINTDAVEFSRVPSFYALASNRPVEDIAPPDVLKRLRLGPSRLRFRANEPANISLPFEEAIVRQKAREDLYKDQAAAVYFLGDTLFRTTIAIPANVPVGDYIAEFYLFRDGELMSAQSSPLFIKKSGLGRTIFDFAQDYPALYGIAAIIVALFAGWLASIIYRKD